jgi:putative endonuclease
MGCNKDDRSGGNPYADEPSAGTSLAAPPGMKYVYLIRSLAAPGQRYVGVTSNLEERLRAHDIGASPHTSKYRPWELATYICFTDDQRALEFEKLGGQVWKVEVTHTTFPATGPPSYR